MALSFALPEGKFSYAWSHCFTRTDKSAVARESARLVKNKPLIQISFVPGDAFWRSTEDSGIELIRVVFHAALSSLVCSIKSVAVISPKSGWSEDIVAMIKDVTTAEKSAAYIKENQSVSIC